MDVPETFGGFLYARIQPMIRSRSPTQVDWQHWRWQSGRDAIVQTVCGLQSLNYEKNLSKAGEVDAPINLP